MYKTDFEDVVKDNYDEEIITINGIRWKCINAKIENNPLRTIPEGKKALALKAYRSHVNEDGCTTFEMLDDLPEGANKVSFEAVAFGQDGLFTPDGWRFEYSTDQGATWAFQKFSMPAKPEVVEYSVETFEPTRFRIRYLPDPPESDKKGQRILIDALRVTHNDDFNTPARIMMDLYDGYQTSNNYLTFSPDFRGEFGLADPDNPGEWTDMFNSYIEVRLDGEVVKKISAIPEDYVAKIENISAGDHQLEIELKHVGTKQVWGPEKLIRKIDFTVKPIESIKGLAALKNAEVGKFYEVTPIDNTEENRINVNMLERYRAQKYLLEGKKGILVDDPRYYSYQHKIIPDNQQVVTKMRGQLVEMDNNLVFLLDRSMDQDTLDIAYNFKTFKAQNFAELNAETGIEGVPIFMDLIEFPENLHNLAVAPNATYTILDKDAAEFKVYIGYSQRLYSNQLQALPDSKVKLFAIYGNSFSLGEPCLIPVFWTKTNTVGVEDVKDDHLYAAYYSKQDGNLHLMAPGKAKAMIFDMKGEKIVELNFVDSHNRALTAAPGAYVVVIVSDSGSKMFKIMK